MRNALVKDTIIYGFSDFLLKVISFAVFPIFTHMFTVEEFGIIELIGTIVGLISIFLNLGINNAVQRFYFDPEVEPSHRGTIISAGFWILTIWSSAVTILCILAFSIFYQRIEQGMGISLLILTIALVSNVPSQIVQYALDTVRLYFAPVSFSILSIIKNLLGVALQIVLVVAGYGIAGYYLGSLAGLVIAIPLAIWLIRRDLHPMIDRGYGRQLIQFGYPFIFAGMAYWIFGSIDRWMLVQFSNLTQVGLYSISFKFCMLMVFVSGAFGQAWSPYTMKLYGENPDYRTIFGQILTVWYLVLTVLGISLALFSPELLYLTTTAGYWPAATSLGILAIGFIFQGTTQITAIGISIEKRTRLISYAAWITAGINVGLNLYLIPVWGATGAALATTISYFFLTGFYLVWTQRLHRIFINHRALVGTTVIIGLFLTAIPTITSLPYTPMVLLVKILITLASIGLIYLLRLIPEEVEGLIKGTIADLKDKLIRKTRRGS